MAFLLWHSAAVPQMAVARESGVAGLARRTQGPALIREGAARVLCFRAHPLRRFLGESVVTPHTSPRCRTTMADRACCMERLSEHLEPVLPGGGGSVGSYGGPAGSAEARRPQRMGCRRVSSASCVQPAESSLERSQRAGLFGPRGTPGMKGRCQGCRHPPLVLRGRS